VKILMVTHYFESHRGGIEIIAGRLLRELSRLGHQTVWVATDASPPPETIAFRVVPIPANNTMENRLGVPFPVPTIRSARMIAREVQACDAVIMHDALYLTTVLAFAAARRFRKPAVIVQHIGTVPYRNPLLRVLMAIGNHVVARPLLTRADRVVFYSQIAARYFASVRFAAPPEWVFNGVDIDLFHPLADTRQRAEIRERMGLPLDRPVVLFVGRFVEKKGLHILERMVRLRPKIHWAFAGWGPMDPRAWCMPNVSVLADLSGATLVPLYQACDLLVLPSTGEGFPLVVQEALACGLPVACGLDTSTADPAAAPLLTGISVDQNDLQRTAAEFCAAVDRTIADPSPLHMRAEERHRFARQHYSWNFAAGRYVEVLEALLKRTPSMPL
jgi:glycosyltransferase involved in cell wall biosynthesis